MRDSDNFEGQSPAEKTDDFINHYSEISGFSKSDSINDHSDVNNMLSKIDEVLGNARRVQSKKGSKYLDEFIERKSMKNSSSSFVDSQVSDQQFLPSGRSSKLKTIEE